ncbi:MAG: hypothetical protein AAF191_05780 [Verrucomicrobiota bacterium]
MTSFPKLRPLALPFLFTVALSSSILPTSAQEERNVPPGLHLSATLSLFRNIPLLLDGDFIPTTGPVSCLFEETQTTRGDAHEYTTDYHFYRAAVDGQILRVSLQEVHQVRGTEEIMKDTKQSAALVPQIPSGAGVAPVVSPIVAYVLDHREPLVSSPAGEIARTLHFTAEGKLRGSDYAQPRVSIVVKEGAEEIPERIRIFGLEALLTDEEMEAATAEPGAKPVHSRVFELSMASPKEALVEWKPITSAQ